jgi:hypothetical protein
LDYFQVRFHFGCFDQIVEGEKSGSKKIRVCNWIRFLKSQIRKDCTGVNLLGRFDEEKRPIFEFVDDVSSNHEIVAYFDVETIQRTQSVKIRSESRGERWSKGNLNLNLTRESQSHDADDGTGSEGNAIYLIQ